jgi:hypothetical protein
VNLLKSLLVVAAVLGAVRIFHFIRGRAMRALAEKLGFRYIGPAAPPKWWWNPSHFEIHHPIPTWLSHLPPSGQRIRQVWNVIEGNKNGVSVLIFDVVVGEYRGGHPCTVIACQTQQNPFAIVSSVDRVVQTHGWTVLHGVWFLWFSWTMGTRGLEDRLSELRPE